MYHKPFTGMFQSTVDLVSQTKFPIIQYVLNILSALMHHYPYVLKMCAANLSKPLYLLFKQSLTTGTLPRDWKTANIIQIYKRDLKVIQIIIGLLVLLVK